MERHAAFPYRENFKRVGKIIRRRVEQDFTQPAADDDTQHAIEQHIVQVFLAPSGGRHVRLLDAHPAKNDELRKRKQIHQSVPAYGKGT